jgi:hypothetical protein
MSDKNVKYVEFEIPECYKVFQDFMADNQNLVRQSFPVSYITKHNVIYSYIQIRALLQDFVSEYFQE